MMDYSDTSDMSLKVLFTAHRKKTHPLKGRYISCLLINSINSKIMSSLSPKIQLLMLLSPYRH